MNYVNKINGIADKNSNGSRLFLNPGIQYVTRRWITEAAIQIPVSQDINVLALENVYIGRLSVRVNLQKTPSGKQNQFG